MRYLEDVMLNRKICEQVLELALSRGGDFAELYCEDSRSFSMVLRSGRIENAGYSRPYGAGLRVYDGTRSIYMFTSDTSDKSLLQLARRAAEATTVPGKKDIDQLRRMEMPNLHPWKIRTLDVDAQNRAELLRAADSAARSAGEAVQQVTVSMISRECQVQICNSEGLFVQDTRMHSRLTCSVVAGDGKENQTGTASRGAMRGYELFSEVCNPEQMGREAADSACRMLKASYCRAGEMPVIIAGGFGGVIFHEACGHALEATSVQPGNSVFCGKLGQQIASSCVTAIDDGTIPNEWGSENVDDEGIPTTRLVLIENGILKNYMVDRFNGRKMGMPSTGSGRRESYKYAPTSRMHNTFIAPGQDEAEEMLRTMGEGLYASKLGGGSVNPTTGEFNFSVTEGYMVRDGKICEPVRGATLIGKGEEILMRIDRVGRDLKLDQGMCGSISGSIPVDVGQPTIRVSKMTVGGK